MLLCGSSAQYVLPRFIPWVPIESAELLCTDPHSIAFCSASLQVLRLSPAAMQTVTFSVVASTTSSAVKTTKGVANEVLSQVRLLHCGSDGAMQHIDGTYVMLVMEWRTREHACTRFGTCPSLGTA